MDEAPHPEPLASLWQLLRELRGPGGNPWDQRQDPASAARHLADEVHELCEAAPDPGRRGEELADCLVMLLFNVLLHEEESGEGLGALASRGEQKLRRRLGWEGGPAPSPPDEASAREAWERAKARDREGGPPPSVLPDLAASASPLRQAWMYGHHAAQVDFDWEGPPAVLLKLREELEELAEAREGGDDRRVREEMGDVLFACVQLARKLGVDPDLALRGTNAKFAARFRRMEELHGHDVGRLRGLGGARLHELWHQVKRERREGGEENP